LKDHFELMIAVWSETAGARHFVFSTHDKSGGFPPFELLEQPQQIVGGPQIDPRQVQPPITTPIGHPAFLERHGADVMELMRRQNFVAPILHEGLAGFVIGGQCDLTTVNAAGVETVALRKWDDRIGEKVQPYGRNVASITRMTRQQRRSAKRYFAQKR
jgi:hypothetical protein